MHIMCALSEDSGVRATPLASDKGLLLLLLARSLQT